MKLFHIFSDQVEVRSEPGFEPQPAVALDLAKLPYAPDTDAYYLINVHAFVSVDDKAQNQSGLRVYRHLLKRYDGNQDKLKVIFYSPMAKEVLVSLKPENYVLMILPFIQTTYDGKLLVDLHDAVEDYKERRPQFNNASENLLSGWSLLGAKKINLRSQKPLVIDDEWKDWVETYRSILNKPPDFFLSNADDIKTEFRKLNLGTGKTFKHLHNGALKDHHFVIQDLYLWERHDTQKWKTEDLIKSISGLRLFEKIREIEPAIPVVFHTTSTKYRIYESLNSLGAEGQISKNINPDATNDEKEETCRLLCRKLEAITGPYFDCWLNKFFRYLEDPNGFGKSWLCEIEAVKKSDLLLDDIVFLLQNLILDYKNMWRLDTKYLERWFGKRKRKGLLKPFALTVSGIIVNAGKLIELDGSLRNNPELAFLDKIRDAAAHSRFEMLQRIDVLTLLILIEKTFNGIERRSIGSGQGFPKNLASNPDAAAKRNHPVLHYAHYYANWSDYIPDGLKSEFEKRIRSLFADYIDKQWNPFPSDIRRRIVDSVKVMNAATSNEVIFGNDTCRLDVVI